MVNTLKNLVAWATNYNNSTWILVMGHYSLVIKKKEDHGGED